MVFFWGWLTGLATALLFEYVGLLLADREAKKKAEAERLKRGGPGDW
jgi:hypothetical protein